MPYIHSIATAFPEHEYSQEQLIEAIQRIWGTYITPAEYQKVLELQHHVEVEKRALALPIEAYKELHGLEKRTQAFQDVALKLAISCVSSLLEKAQLTPKDVQVLVSNTTTGLAVPSLDAKLMNHLDFPSNTKRLPFFGLGCLAGTAALNRMAEYLRGDPKAAVVLFAVELCSVNMEFADTSMTNKISSGLFGDGAAAVLMVGDEHPLAKGQAALKWVGGHSLFFPETERVMGWDFVDSGMKILMGKEIPDYAVKSAAALPEFLADLGLSQDDLSWFCFHPGGPKILHVLEEAMALTKQDLRYSHELLAKRGNVSSVSVLAILADMLAQNAMPPHSKGLLMSLGPAFCSEFGVWERC